MTPFAFALTGLAFAYGLVRYRLLDLVPIARDVLVENMSSGVLVLDAQNRLVDINLAARRVMGSEAVSAIGRPAEYVLAAWPDLIASFPQHGAAGDALLRAADRALYAAKAAGRNCTVVWRAAL